MRCKVICNLIQVHNSDSNTLTFTPVTTGSEENKQFFRWTPGGSFIVNTVNPNILDQFVQGQEYYVDFSPCEK